MMRGSPRLERKCSLQKRLGFAADGVLIKSAQTSLVHSVQEIPVGTNTYSELTALFFTYPGDGKRLFFRWVPGRGLFVRTPDGL